MRSHKIVGILIIIGSLGLIAFQATKNESTVTFFTPAEVYANPLNFKDKVFRVSGLVLEGSKVWDAQGKNLSFRMSDLKGHEFLVNYHGAPPDLFKERQGVIVEGRLINLAQNKKSPLEISSNLLMVKHSEVYTTQDDHSEMRQIRLQESLFNEIKK